MARPLLPLKLNIELQEILQTITRSREAPHSLVQRALIVLSASAGSYNKTISQELGLCEETVGFWRKRWVDNGAELEKFKGKPKPLRETISQVQADKPRPGSPGLFSAEQVCRLLAVACETPPEHLSHWTPPELARNADQPGDCGNYISPQCRAFFIPTGAQEIRGI